MVFSYTGGTHFTNKYGNDKVSGIITLNNLLAIPKFKPLVESFEVGNWIRVQVDNRIFKLRLLEYEIDFGDFEKLLLK